MPSDHSSDRGDDEQVSQITRRYMMWATGTAALSTSLAGCGGDGSDGTPTGTETQANEDDDMGDDPTETEADPTETGANTVTTTAGETVLHSAVSWNWEPADTNLNGFAGSNYPGAQEHVFFPPMISYSFVEDEFIPIISKGLPEMEGCTIIMDFKQDPPHTWWDGKPVTAKDRVYGHTLNSYACCGGPDEVPWVAYMGENEYQFREDKIGPFNEQFRAQNMKWSLPDKSTFIKPYYDRVVDASSDEEINTTVEEVTNVQVTLDDAMEDGFGYGLWQPVDYDSSTVTFEVYEDHLHADRTNIDQWVWHVFGNRQSEIQAIKNGQLDIGEGNLNAAIDNVPDNLETIVQYPGLNGLKLAFNWDPDRNPFFGRRPVRRAIGYMLNIEGLSNIITGGATPVAQQTAGMPDKLVEKYVGSDFLDQIIDYGVQPKTEKANQVMQNAGFSKSGGYWQDEDGNQMKGLRFISTSAANTAQLGDTIAGLLDDFGIGTDYTAMEGASYQEVMDPIEGTQEYDLVLHNAGPNFPIPAGLWNHFSPQIDNIGGAGFNLEQPEECNLDDPQPPVLEYPEDLERSRIFGIPWNPWPEVPTEYGQEDLSGDTMQIPLGVRSRQLRLNYSEETLREFSRKIAWWVNFHLPAVYLLNWDAGIWMNTDKFKLREGAVIREASDESIPPVWGDVVTR